MNGTSVPRTRCVENRVLILVDHHHTHLFHLQPNHYAHLD